MTLILFQRCDGKPAGAPIALPRGRRRLSSIVRDHADRARPHIVSVHRKGHALAVTDFSVRLRKKWRHTSLGPLDTVIIVYCPRGGGGASARGGGGAGKGASIGLIVATVALAAIGQFWAIGAIGSALGVSAGVAGAIWAAGSTALLAGAGYLLSRATQAKANKEDANRPVYGVSGGGNQPRAGDRVPVVFGRFWNTPDLSQPDYTVYEGDDQILFKRVTVGCGKYAIKEIRVGDATMWTAAGGILPPFIGTELEIIAPGGASALVPGQVATVQAVSGNEIPRAGESPAYAGPFDFGAEAPAQTRIQLDYSLPQGVYAVGTGRFEGKQFPTDWGVLFEYAPCDLDGNPTGAFTPLFQDGGTLQTTRPARYTRFVDVPSGRYTFRAQNQGLPPEVNGSQIVNTVVWEGLRAHIAETIVRQDVTEIAFRIRSGKALGVTAFAAIEVLSVKVLPVWNGSIWSDQETRKSVWAAAYILRDAAVGAGMADSQIDLTRLLHYASLLSEYDTYDGVIRGPVSVYEALTTVLGTMRASPLRLGNVWSLVRDEQKDVRKHLVSRRQILKDSTGQRFNLDLSDGSADVIVEWHADGDPKRRREHRVTFGTVTNVPRRMMAEGVTDAEHAIHLATWAAATAYYRRERRSLTMELAGRLILPNDKALIDAWYFDATESVGVTGRSSLTLLLDQDFTLPSATSYGYLRARDGREWGPVLLTQVSASSVSMDVSDVSQAASLTGLTIDEVLSTATQPFTTLVIGELPVVSESWLVRSVGFSGDEQVNIEAIYDAPEVWTALGEAIIGPPPPPSSGLVNQAAISISYVTALAAQRGTQLYMDWSCGLARAPVNYVIRISYDDWESFEDAYHGPSYSGSYPIRDTNGFIKVRAFAYAQNGLRSATVSTQFSAPRAVVSGETATVRIDYEELKAALRYRTRLLPNVDPIFEHALEGMAESWNANQLAESGIRYTEQVEIEANRALVATRTELRAELASGFALVDERIVALVEEDQAISGRLTEFEAELGEVGATLSEEQVARATADSALAQQITSLSTSVDGRFASTNFSLQALTNQQGAFAQQISTLSASFGQFTVGGEIRFAAVAAPAGVFARYSVILNASSNGGVYETGLYFELIANGGGGFYSQLFLDVNRFIIGDPNSRKVPFQVVDGVTYIDDVVIRRGTLSQHASTESAGSSVSAPLTVRAGSRVAITVIYQGNQQLVNGLQTHMVITRNGATLKVVPISFQSVPVNAGSFIAFYSATPAQASYDVGADGVETVGAYLIPASGLASLELVGLSINAVCFNK